MNSTTNEQSNQNIEVKEEEIEQEQPAPIPRPIVTEPEVKQEPDVKIEEESSDDTSTKSPKTTKAKKAKKSSLLKNNRNYIHKNKKDGHKYGKWTAEEEEKYRSFLVNFKNMHPSWTKSEARQKRLNIFIEMSKFIKTRTPEQCRSHDQKAIKKLLHPKTQKSSKSESSEKKETPMVKEEEEPPLPELAKFIKIEPKQLMIDPSKVVDPKLLQETMGLKCDIKLPIFLENTEKLSALTDEQKKQYMQLTQYAFMLKTLAKQLQDTADNILKSKSNS